MPKTVAVIRRKQCSNTGLDEVMADRLMHRVGTYVTAIVELFVEEPHGPTADGKQGIDLLITQINPVPLDDQTGAREHIQEIAKTLDYNRRLAVGDEPTLDGTEPAPIGQVIAQGSPFVVPEALADDEGEGGEQPTLDEAGDDEGDEPAVEGDDA